MKIIALEAENLKKIRAVNIRPDGNLVAITGRNGQGKTSILDAIWWAIAGASHIQAKPIREGAEQAIIRLDLGEVKVTRKFRRAKKDGEPTGEFTTEVLVENADGARFPSPQRMLDSLLGELTFDPLAFTRMAPKDQFETLKRFVPDVDFAAIEKANKADYDERTNINRRAKEVRAAAGRIELPAGCPTDRRDEAALVDQLQQAGDSNAEIEKRRANRQAAADKIERLKSDRQDLADGLPGRLEAIERRRSETVADIEQQIEALRQRLASVNAAADAERTDLHDSVFDEIRQIDTEAEELQAKLDAAPALPEPVDTTALRQQIASARDHNELVAKRQERERFEKEAADLEAQSAALTKAMADREEAKRKAIASAALPVKGLGFGDDAILMNGVPFDQASDAEQLRASIAIAMASNPKLRVVRVRDGSLLDEDGMRVLAEMADQSDVQVWIERVDGSGKVGFVIEDGSVKASPPPVTSAAPQEGMLV